jgi:aryl-alcohol dehydrogenase-like predicted oxidoreductase
MNGLTRYHTIQNNFSFLNRRFEDELAMICRREGVSLLPYSPIGGGVLSGKYNGDSPPENARFSRYLKLGDRQKRMSNRFLNDKTLESTAKLLELAAQAGLSPVTLAVAWSKQHDFVASTIIGANTVEQLEESLKAFGLELQQDLLDRLDEISKAILYPMG